MFKRFLAGALVVGMVIMSQSTMAEELIGNLGDGNGTQTVFGAGSTTVYKAAGWTMGAEARTLLDIRVDLDFLGDTAETTWELWSGATTPQVAEVTLDFQGPQTGAGVYSLTSDGFEMQAGETYWVYALNDISQPAWAWRASADAPTGSVAFAGYIFNDNPSAFQNMFSVRAVPEPSACVVLGLTAIAGVMRRRRA